MSYLKDRPRSYVRFVWFEFEEPGEPHSDNPNTHHGSKSFLHSVLLSHAAKGELALYASGRS